MRSLVRTASRASARTTTPASAAWAAVLTMALLCAGVVAPATSAARVLASGGNSLPLPGYADMAVHDKAGRVYITAGRSSNALLSVDFRGRVRKVLDRQSGATGLVLSADHGTLYVALSAGDAISAIDTTTFKEVARYPTGARTCPAHLARTGTDVWFGYGCDDDWNGGIGRLDTAATPPTVKLGEQGSAVRFQRAPYLAATRDDGPLVAGRLELSLSELTVFSVSGGTLTGGASGSITGSNLTDLDVSPCGERQLFTAAGSREEVGAYATTDLAGRGAYHTSAFPNSTAASPRGCFIATGRRTGEGRDVFVYRIGGAAPVRSFALGAGVVLAPRGLAWCATEKLLFAVVLSARDGAPSLRTLAHPAGDGGR